MAPPLLTITEMALRFGETPLFEGLELSIGDRDRISLVGRNGSGKSTLMKVIAGQVEADYGERFLQPGCHVTYLDQEPDLSGYDTLHDYVASGLSEASQEETYRVDIILEDIKLDPLLDPTKLSGGEGRRAALARALISDADILLLDEPTNHLDIQTIQWLEESLAEFRGGLVIISHDRTFLNNVTNTTFWLDRGRVRRLDKGFAHFEEWSETIIEQERVERAKLDKLIEKETDWSHKGITARRKRNMGRMRNLWALREQRADQIAVTGQAKLGLESGKAAGKKVIEAKDISKSFNGEVIFEPFSLRVMRGDRIGIIGPNGVGKTTLLKVLTGQLAPDTGTVTHGTNLEITFLDQKRALLDENATLWDTLSDGGDHIMVRGHSKHIVSYLKDFLFDAGQVRSPVSSLSGGEKNRLVLAKTLALPTNFLILDEPTNDLDMDTLDLLQDMLGEYDGTLILVSHDRDFLDRIVTSSLVLEGDGKVLEYPGGYQDYIRQRASRKAEEAAAAAAAKKAAKPVDAPQNRAVKLSYKHQRALENLPKEIAKLESDITKFQIKLGEVDFYSKDPEGFSKINRALEAAMADLAAKEEEWLELEMLREEMK
ncbi:ABC-F family ATP-binding cassette domain-containing protein [Paremcibacter congregatus]|uniref:ATP-binding protein Uup n=1 Tax=Paremcibacter congregatus TaxID=2043170 RepID=A0A2G4YQ07_9PROT|nr:ATP-binding cassette domain-containing protein [Paremcibacter congregatus]PHZ84411.1 elongation factor 3 [Paremcibacter congregatus]QDE28629.1 ATP-binding cassette domain-containing protein [Paremcibacter congregatus]